MKEIFKEWVPDWLIKIILFSGLMPSMVLFFLPGANINVTAGYYGCQLSDVQLLIVLFYAGFVGFYILERRFFQFFPTKHYYIIFNLLQIVNCMLMYTIRTLEWIFILRFLQGMLFASAVNLSISGIFVQLKTEKAKEASYSIFFCLLLCSAPFNTFVTADFIDSFNFDELYFYAAVSFVPGLLLLLISMRSIRHSKSYPLFSLDWSSFILYSIFMICFGYMMVYGQEVCWFTDSNMITALVIALMVTLIFVMRQFGLKRAYIQLDIFQSKNMLLGMLVLYIMYIERFSLSIANQYFIQILHLDPIHLSYVQWFNIIGVIVGVVVSFYWLLAKHPVKWLWTLGFCSLLFFHQLMYFSFNGDGNEYYFYIPLVVHGLGVGLIMVPTILFVISSVKTNFGVSAAAICLAIRYIGYTSSIAFQNFFKLFDLAQHQTTFGDKLGKDNPILRQYLIKQSSEVVNNGLTYKEYSVALKLVAQRVANESFVRYAMDYYELMSIISICLLMLIVFSPSLTTMYKKLKTNVISPA